MPQPSATKPLGLPFIELQSVDSTNNYARQQLHAGLAQHGMTFFAHEQVAGKGQRGKIWITEKGKNILMSMVVKPYPLLLAQQFQLSACVAVALQEFFMRYAGEDTKIKWPNDLYWQDRKAGGILIESVIGGSMAAVGNPAIGHTLPGAMREWTSIIGIGININQVIFDPAIKSPVSLKQITGKDFDTVALAKELCAIVDKRFKELLEAGFENIYTTYLTHLYKSKSRVKLKKGAVIFEAMIETVSPAGKLVTQHGMREEFNFGEVEWMI